MQEMDEHEEDSESMGEQQGGCDYGFKPMEEPVMDEKKKRAREESEESKSLKREILKYVARYPELELRSSKQIMEKMNEMGEDELRIVRDNCITDLTELRGTPVSSFILFCITQPVDWKLPGYTDVCLNDVELKRDVESEIISLLGELSTRINIFFRLINNVYITWKKSKSDWHDGPKTKSKSDGENDGADDNKRKGDEAEDGPFQTTTPTSQSPW